MRNKYCKDPRTPALDLERRRNTKSPLRRSLDHDGVSRPPTCMLEDRSTTMLLTQDPMRYYRAKKDTDKPRVADKYSILGFISSGTYGRVYKAQSKGADGKIHAIKKFKPDKEGDVITYTGISQSAIREIAVSLVVSPVRYLGGRPKTDFTS